MKAEDDSKNQTLERLVDEEGARLLALVRRSCGDGSDAEDVVQKAFANAVRG